MKKSSFVLGGAGVLAAAAIVFAATRVSPHTSGPATASARPMPVQVTRATVQDATDSFDVGGDVRAGETATLVSRIVAPITQVFVRPGDHVRAGQALVLLDARDLTAGRTRAEAAVDAAREAGNVAAAERQAAEATLVLAKATYKRISDLRAKSSATPNELDEASAGLRGAEARLAGAEAQIAQAAARLLEAQANSNASAISLSYATITAPFDGVVTQKQVDAGNMASPGVPLVTIDDTRTFRLEVRIDQSRASLIKMGQAVDVALDRGVPAADRWLAGRVAEVSQVLDENAHAFLVKISLPGIDGVRSGMFGRARFAGSTRRALAVPASSIIRHGQLTSVFVVDSSGAARLRLVSVGEPAGARAIEVRAGLEAGETVIVDPPPALIDGAPVAARPAAAIDGTPEGRA